MSRRRRQRIIAARRIMGGGAAAVGPAPVFSQLGTAVLAVGADHIDLQMPGTLADNEVAIAIVACALTPGNTIDSWGGGTELWQEAVGVTDFSAGASWERMSSLGGGSLRTIEFASITNSVGCIVTFTGCKTTGDPFEGLNHNSGTSTSVTGQTITTTNINRLGFFLAMIGRGNATTPPATWTERLDSNGTGGGVRIICETKALATAGVEPAAAISPITSDDWLVITGAFLPT